MFFVSVDYTELKVLYPDFAMLQPTDDGIFREDEFVMRKNESRQPSFSVISFFSWRLSTRGYT